MAKGLVWFEELLIDYPGLEETFGLTDVVGVSLTDGYCV